jgi:hypothetical protein
MTKTLLAASILLSYCTAVAQGTDSTHLKLDPTKHYTTAWVKGTPPLIDGKLDDPAWEQVEWGGGDFRQLQPDKGKPASVVTKFKILYDEKNLYIGIRAFDPEPKKIVRRMSRRDTFEGDFVEVNIDSYYDKRTAFSFTSSVSGVKGDEYVSNNGDDWDEGWDPIWYLKTSIDEEGWIAEFRIPLSQLRFANLPELKWGIQIMRNFFRKQERSIWQYIPPDQGGWVHLFADLDGIKGIKPQKQLEIQPYVLTQTETSQEEEGNPYQTGSASSLNMGLDAKIGITSDITLDLTVNPDFGQVEADPSQVNLSAFELFFQERRPFFLEGNNTLNFPIGDGNNNLFYSRRIGRPPQGFNTSNFYPPNQDPPPGFSITDLQGNDNVAEHVKPNRQTTILGAAKITGKNKRGFSWGVLETLTPKEYAEIDSLGHKRKVVVEPVTNYFIARAQQDVNKGNTILGGIFTSTNRKIEDSLLTWLHTSAYSGGVDFTHHWKARTYYISAKALMSHVQGSKKAITNTQLSSERFFQRPDNHHTEFDPSRRSLTGTGGTLILGKKAGNIVSDLGVTWTSPELELNDLGFLAQTDNIAQWFWVQYRKFQPSGPFRSQRYNINQYQDWDFGGRALSRGYNINFHHEWKNYWRTGYGGTYNLFSQSNADLRGGPAVRYPGSVSFFTYFFTDPRKKLNMIVEYFGSFGREDYRQDGNIYSEITYRPINALNITVSPSFSKSRNAMQYVATEDAGGSTRYVVGEIDQEVFRVSLRLTYMITPNLSIQYWGQPFGTTGSYENFKSVTDSKADSYRSRFSSLSPFYSSIDGRYHVDEDADGNVDYGFGRPDFNFGQFRSNMVIRWEYIPGSTLFLVWNQEQNGAFYTTPNEQVHKRYHFDFSQKALNIFLLKFTYRWRL